MSQKLYDFAKAKKYIDERIESIESASLGMHEDWFWTANTVFENGEYKIDLTDPECKIGGINGSVWATPTLRIAYKDGEEEMVECSTGEQDMSFGEKVENKIMWTSGCLSSEVQNKIAPLKQINE